VLVNGIALNGTCELKAIRDACAALGLSKSGSKSICLKRVWTHSQNVETIAVNAAEPVVQQEIERNQWSSKN
jgi:hypothetical protein